MKKNGSFSAIHMITFKRKEGWRRAMKKKQGRDWLRAPVRAHLQSATRSSTGLFADSVP